ncbi:MAG TPA: hypothetical protein VH643_09395 [Gemmataceae bacterium]
MQPDATPLTARLTAAAAENPELTRIIDAWPSLPVPIRRAVLALIGSASGGQDGG